MSKRRLTGIIVSDKMTKTVVVETVRFKQHPKYLRRIQIHERYKAHDEKGEFHTGDRVVIEESRPLSKDKRWRVVEKL
ncbi:MAG: 30S ribosomal protein S17 [Candidatus Wildermuthbacteria bacterium]|nr:30S ribosomal protein S17 [Candidatus Wildermuthbacteria bacterium]